MPLRLLFSMATRNAAKQQAVVASNWADYHRRALAVFFVNWWLTAFWIVGLFALMGGRVISSGSTPSRLPNILASSYLLSVLLLWIVPKLLNASDDMMAARFLFFYILPLLPLIILILPKNDSAGVHTPNIDFFYSLLIFLLTLILYLVVLHLALFGKLTT